MIVSSQNTADISQNRENKKEAQKSSDRFARLLDSNTKQQRDRTELARRIEKQNACKTEETSSVQPSAIANVADNPSDSSRAHIESTAAQTASATPALIQRLAEELGQHIDLHVTRGGTTQAVDMSFTSRSIARLKVQIRQNKGQLSIRFVSQSALTAKLLSLHAPHLQESLESKGVKIQNIAIATSRSGSSIGRRDVEA